MFRDRDRYQINGAEGRGDKQFTLKICVADPHPSLCLHHISFSVRASEVYVSSSLRTGKVSFHWMGFDYNVANVYIPSHKTF